MENKEYLSEERYQKNKKKIVTVALMILILGLLIGGSLIAKGINKSKDLSDTYNEENKQTKINNLNEQINTEKINLETKKAELQSKGLKPSREYDSGEAYDLYIITNVLDPSFSHCVFDEYKNNSLTSKYCSLKEQLEETERLDVDFEKNFNNFHSIKFYIFGAFIIIASCMISGSIYMFAKKREITAFTTQQIMPVAQEGINKMTPTIKNSAKEIAKGIKDGIKDEDK